MNRVDSCNAPDGFMGIHSTPANHRLQPTARTPRHLSAGATISDSHGTDFETFLASAVKVKNAVTSGDPVPFHIVTGMKLNQDISTGTVLTQGMVKELGASPLWKLRAQQDGG